MRIRSIVESQESLKRVSVMTHAGMHPKGREAYESIIERHLESLREVV